MNNLLTNINSLLPTYSTELPFSKQTVYFTPFKVKDAKNISIILQEENKILSLKAMVDLLKNCCLEINPEELCLADAEYLFLMIRSKSVEENLNLIVNGNPIQINIFEIKGKNNFVKEEINVSNNLTLKVETPKIKNLLQLKVLSKKNLLLSSIKFIVAHHEIYNVETFIPKELENFLENLPLNILTQLEKLNHPELCVNLENKENESEVSGPLTFFTFP